MRKILIFFLGFFVISVSSSFAQTLMDYVKEVKGDTLVVNDWTDMGALPNSINNVIANDNAAPAGRVYQLQTGGWYPQTAGFTTPSDRAVIIAGADNTPIVNRTNAANKPPIISGYNDENGAAVGGITYANDFTLKNTSIIIGAPDGTGGWAFFGAGASNSRIVFENNIMEHTWWIFVNSNGREGNSFYFKDNYFVNMSGRACRRNGGVYDNVDFNTDTMYVENNTHVMAQGMMYKFRNYPVKWIFINHNNFINCSGLFFETQGFQSNVIITNNIFVNSNIHPHTTPYVGADDRSEIDIDGLPSGLVNVAPLPGTMEQVDRKWLVEANVAYWDPKVADLSVDANAMAINGKTSWVNQAIKMNTRTASMFADAATYPYLTEGIWYDKLPAFTNTANLFTDQLDVLKTFVLGTVDTTSTNVLPDWRVVNTAVPDDYINSDFPIPINLAYSDADLMTGGTDGLPVGDLNWFPQSKATFNANQATYYNALVTALNSGNTVITSVKELGGLVKEYRLLQNYPNPFNPSTTIDFSLPEAGYVTLKVYDALGKEIATLVDGFKSAQSYQVQFDASSLTSGIYFYTLKTENFTKTNKMILMK